MTHRRTLHRTPSFAPICAAICLGCVGSAAADPPAEAATPKSEFAAYAESHPYLNDEFSAGEGSESGIDELERLQEPETPLLDPADVHPGPSGWARGKFDSLYRETGLRLGFAATALGLWANGTGDPDGSAYDIDFMSAWTLVGRGTPDSGVLVVTGEFRDAMEETFRKAKPPEPKQKPPEG